MLFLYTPTALAAEGSVAGIQRRIDAMMASANRVYSNSLTGVRIHLVHFAQVNQRETASMLSAYGNFRNLPEVSTLRENYKADVVFLMVEQEALGFLGLAGGLMKRIPGRSNLMPFPQNCSNADEVTQHE